MDYRRGRGKEAVGHSTTKLQAVIRDRRLRYDILINLLLEFSEAQLDLVEVGFRLRGTVANLQLLEERSKLFRNSRTELGLFSENKASEKLSFLHQGR